MNSEFDRDYPLDLTKSSIPIPQGDNVLDEVKAQADERRIGGFTNLSAKELDKHRKQLHERNLKWLVYDLGEKFDLVYFPRLEKVTDPVGLRARSLGLSGPTLSANEWDRMLTAYGVEEGKRESFINGLIRESKKKGKPFDVVEAVLTLDEDRRALVVGNLDLVSTVVARLQEDRISVNTEDAQRALVGAANCWDKNVHPRFGSYAYSKMLTDLSTQHLIGRTR